MMIQSSALRKLEEVLTNAITNGDANLGSGPILLQAMNLEALPHHVIDFYELLNKAKDEAKNIRTKPNIDRYLQTIEKLHDHFVVHHIWGVPWNALSKYINDKDILNTLDALAEFFHSENPSVFLEEDFLGKLSDQLSRLLREIIQSDLSKELKNSLRIHIEGLLQAIHRYHIDGTRGLKKAAQALISDLMMTEHNLQDSDKKSSTYMTIKAWGLSLLLYITPTPYDIIGAVPDIDGYWRPKFEELCTGHKKIEAIINAESMLTIQEVVKKSSTIFDRQQQKSIVGSKELKSLPASKDEPEVNTSDLTSP